MRKDQAGLVIRERVLLPIDEVVFGFYLEAVGQNVTSAVRCGSQADDLRTQLDRPVIPVMCDMVQCDVNGHKCK